MPKLKIDNPFFCFMGKLGDVVLLNLIWLVCSLPLVTLGASTTALYYTARKIAAGEEYDVWKDFVRSFCQNWRQATLTWLIAAAAGAVALVDFFSGLHMPGAMGNVFRGIGAVLCLLWLAVTGYLFPLLARYEYTLRQLFSNAAFLSAANIPVTVTSMVLVIWLPFLAWKNMNVFLYALPLWLLVGGALSALIVSTMMLPIFRQIEAKGKTKQEELYGNSKTKASL